MGDALVSVVLNQLDSVGDEKEVDRLRNNLLAIKAVILDAEKRQDEEPTVKQWIDKVKAICYDVSDFLDEWNAAILKSKNEDNIAAFKPGRKVFSFVRSCFSSHESDLRHDNIASKIREFNKRLNFVAPIENYFPPASEMDDVKHVSMATSFVDMKAVKGREDDKNKLKGMLLGESGKQYSRPQMISVVGMAGLGKTTLAKLVFNDNEVKTHFEIRIWVWVSYYFDSMRIASEILDLLGCDSPHQLTHADIERVYENINPKKFLLVLDDVWEEDRSKLRDIEYCLGRGLPGSKILVTTRKESVAITWGSWDVFNLGMMSTEECWSIFSETVFFGRTSECEHLKSVGRRIIDKCKGLPLVAKILGGLLRFKQLREEWQRVLDSEVWELEEVERAILAPLRLGYYDLPSAALRLCFSICAIFPKDYMIEKRHLIELWIAQGYINGKPYRKRLNEFGERYFQDLVVRSFFQDYIIDKEDGSITSCKMHDMVLDFARFLTKDECISIEINNAEELRANSFHLKVRHAMVVLQKSATIPNSFYHMKKLRSLFIHSKGNLRIEAALPDLFNQLTCLRSLNLGHCGIKEIPLNINKLVTLRQLDLSLNKNLKELPETICELGNLQILDVSYCDKLVLPRGIEKLVNLSHLHNFESNNPLPKGIQRLTSLEILDNFVVGQDDEAAKLRDLGNLDILRSSFCTTGWFCISGLENVVDVNDLKRARLEGKMDLSTLKLDFGGGRAEWRKSHDEELVEASEEIIRSIEGLWLLDCQATRIFPTRIIEAYKLRTLRLTGCINCELLPPLGRLPFLEFLHLWGMPGVKEVGVEFLGISSSVFTVAFPKLKKLYFVNMGNWEDWIDGYSNEPTEYSQLPLLKHLCLSHCPKLKALPVYILQKTTLEKLDISRGCRILEKRYEKGIGKDWHKISHIPNINISHTIF